MREKRETKVFSEMEGLYGRGRHLRGIRKFEKCNGFSKEI